MKKVVKMTKTKSQEKNKMSEIDEQILKYFDIKKRLGKGAYGIVWKATDKKTNSIVAVKKIFDAFRNETDAQRTFREIMFLRAFRSHPNVIQLFTIHKATNNLDIYLAFEYMESDLHNVIKKGTILKDVHKRYIMCQLFNAIKYIHSGNVIHRDLKPSNVLIDSKCRCKIADFGLARSVSNRPTGMSSTSVDPSEPLLTDYVATRWYRAPEILIASKRYTKGIDMWSLGCILGEMIRGKPLFPGSSTVNQIERIMSSLPQVTEKDVVAIGSGFGSALLNQQIHVNENPSLDDLLNGASDDAKFLVKSLLVLDPALRLTAKEALAQKYIEKYRHSISETELNTDVLPPFRDDIQLTVTEYRSKLYEIMQNKTIDRTSEKIQMYNSKLMNGSKKRDSALIVSKFDNIPVTNTTSVAGNKRNLQFRSEEKLNCDHSLHKNHDKKCLSHDTLTQAHHTCNNISSHTITCKNNVKNHSSLLHNNVSATATNSTSGSKLLISKTGKSNAAATSVYGKQQSSSQNNCVSADTTKVQPSKLKYCKITPSKDKSLNTSNMSMTAENCDSRSHELNKPGGGGVGGGGGGNNNNHNHHHHHHHHHHRSKILTASGPIEKRHSIDCAYNYQLPTSAAPFNSNPNYLVQENCQKSQHSHSHSHSKSQQHQHSQPKLQCIPVPPSKTQTLPHQRHHTCPQQQNSPRRSSGHHHHTHHHQQQQQPEHQQHKHKHHQHQNLNQHPIQHSNHQTTQDAAPHHQVSTKRSHQQQKQHHKHQNVQPPAPPPPPPPPPPPSSQNRSKLHSADPQSHSQPHLLQTNLLSSAKSHTTTITTTPYNSLNHNNRTHSTKHIYTKPKPHEPTATSIQIIEPNMNCAKVLPTSAKALLTTNKHGLRKNLSISGTPADPDLVDRFKLKKIDTIGAVPLTTNQHNNSSNNIGNNTNKNTCINISNSNNSKNTNTKTNINSNNNNNNTNNNNNSNNNNNNNNNSTDVHNANYYEQRLRTLEEKINQHKMDIKEFFYDNQIKSRTRDTKSDVNNYKIHKSHVSTSILNHDKFVNTKIPFIRKVESCKSTKYTTQKDFLLPSKCNYSYSTGDGGHLLPNHNTNGTGHAKRKDFNLVSSKGVVDLRKTQIIS